MPDYEGMILAKQELMDLWEDGCIDDEELEIFFAEIRGLEP